MFKKFPSIERLKNADNIVNLKTFNADYYCVAKEKLDGSNISIELLPDGSVKFYSRNGYDFAEKFYDSYLNEFKNVLQNFKTEKPRYFYGELISPDINRRINYPKTEVKIYCELINDKLYLCDLDSFSIPTQRENIELVSKSDFANSGYCYKEGYVIYLLDKYTHEIKQMFKYKNPDFDDVKSQKHVIPSNIKNLNVIFNTYITENRIIDTLSKGVCNFGEFITSVIDDAKKDFLKSYNISNFDKKQIKSIFKVTPENTRMIISYKGKFNAIQKK